MSTGAPGAGGESADEREVKLAVGAGFMLPQLSILGDVTVTDHGDETLRAVYWDTPQLGLAHAGVGLRHRNGVWTYKGRPRREGHAVVREEVEIDAAGDAIPSRLGARIASWVDPTGLEPVAELATVRHRLDISDRSGEVELVHDRVEVLDGERVATGFEEVEVEFAPRARDLADRVVQLLLGAGAVVDSTPKYLRALRALGHDPREVLL